MKSKFPVTLTLTLATALAAASAHAATISWTAHNITAGDGTADVSTAGTLVDARNGGTSNVTVNGVTFLEGDNPLPAGYNLFDSIFAIDSIGVRRGTNPTGNYATFLSTGQRSGRAGFDGTFTAGVARTTPAEVWATVNLTGLTIGQMYQIQIWASDTNTSLGDAGNKALVLGNGSASGPATTDTHLLYEYADGASAGVYGLGGQYGLGTFVADATTQSFNVRTRNNLLTATPSWTNSDHFSNGWQLRAIPEPRAALLGGLGMLALLRRRRNA